MKERLEAARGRRYVGVAELAQEASRVLAAGGPLQERGTVSEVPDERTVRYYLSEGLLSPAEEKQGTASVFGHLHLLQLLVIKKLQAEHLPIRAIRELVGGRSERQLERMLGGEAEGRTTRADKNEALRYLETLLSKPAPTAARAATAASPAPQTRAKRMNGPLAAVSHAPSERDTWARIEIEPGLELHVREGFRAPAEGRGLRRLARAFLEAVRQHALRAGKRGS